MANFNIDKFMRPKKTITVAGIEIDITKVPLIVNATLDQIYKDMQEIAMREKEGTITEADEKKGLEIIEKLVSMFLLVVSKNENQAVIDREWILTNCDNFDIWNFLSIAANKDNLVTKSVDTQEAGNVGDVKKN